MLMTKTEREALRASFRGQDEGFLEDYLDLREEAQTDDDALEVLQDKVMESGKANTPEEAYEIIFPLLAEDSLDVITGSYAETALWSSQCDVPDQEEPDEGEEYETVACDEIYDIRDFSKRTREDMREDCESFVRRNYADIEASGLNASAIGHNFWLSRNGHGAGFFDLGYSLDKMGKKGVADRLQKAAESEGSVDIVTIQGGKLEIN